MGPNRPASSRYLSIWQPVRSASSSCATKRSAGGSIGEGKGRLRYAPDRIVTCSPDMTLYMRVRGRAPSRRRKADAPMTARRGEATTLPPSVFWTPWLPSETQAWYNSPRCAMSDTTANHVGQNTCEFRLSSSSSKTQSTLTACPNPFLVSLGWRSRGGLCPTCPVLAVPHHCDPAVGSHINSDPASRWTIHMNLPAVNQNSPKFRMCGVWWGPGLPSIHPAATDIV
jgi:hypothetical protein